jgi:3'(2'), 5'-bisphosphate nucleotidase
MEKAALEELLDEVKITAVEAGEIIMEVYTHTDFDIMLKSDNSPLTLADKKGNDVICARLHQIDPNIPIISEENKLIPFEERKEYEYFWMVDPLDGTKEFIKKNGEFTVNIALIKGNIPVLGVVYVPVTRTLYWASKGLGAFKMTSESTGPIKANAFSKNDPGLRVVCSRSHLDNDTQRFINQLNNPIKIAKGSSLKFLVLAEGGAEFYPRLAPTMEWDTAAAHIILEEAGGKIHQAHNSQPLEYNKENLLNPFFIATANQKDG